MTRLKERHVRTADIEAYLAERGLQSKHQVSSLSRRSISGAPNLACN